MVGEVFLWQALLNGIGWVLARIYDVVPNYAVAILVLTLLIRVVLLPLGIKQIKSMQAMQAIQPRIKELQRKYKGNKQRVQEETMKVYREAGVNPLGGCLPLLLQFPILIAMYSVLRPAPYEPVRENGQLVAYELSNEHLPIDSRLFRDVLTQSEGSVPGLNLHCSVLLAGTDAPIRDLKRQPVRPGLPLSIDGTDLEERYGLTSRASFDCGSARFPAVIPYAVLLAFMVGSTFYSQRQMQKASPPGASSQQQQTLLRVMPIMFGVFGLSFPASLVLYWTASNLFQIGQQTALLRAGHIGPEALERRIAEQRERTAKAGERKPGFMARLMERAEQQQKERERQVRQQRSNQSKPGGKRPPNRRSSGGGRGPQGGKRKPKA